jgi:hypothetical protein
MDPKFIYSLQAALVFLVISSPLMYKTVQMVFGKLFTVAVNGCPTIAGLLLHTLVFGLVVYILMVVQKSDDEYIIIEDDGEEVVEEGEGESEEVVESD